MNENRSSNAMNPDLLDEMRLIAKRMAANLMAMRSVDFSQLVEQPLSDGSDLCGGVRWWSSSSLDLVRTPNGEVWLLLPPGYAAHPPLMSLLYTNERIATIRDIAEHGGVVVPRDLPLARELEPRLVSSRG